MSLWKDIQYTQQTKPYLLAIFSYVLIFNLFTGLSFTEYPTSIVGSGPDPYQYIWNADVFTQEVKSVSNPFYTERVAFPKGVSLVMHTYTPIIGVFNLAFGNPYLACNVVLFLSFLLSGLGAFIMAKRFVKSTTLAVFVGFVYAFSPFKMAHLMEHYHLVLTATVPFYFLALMNAFPDGKITLSKKNLKSILLMLILGIVTVFSDYYTTFYLIYLTFGYLIYFGLKRIFGAWTKWKKWALFIVLALSVHLVMEPLVQRGTLDDKGAFYNTADIASLVVPGENSRTYRNSHAFDAARQQMKYKGPNEQVLFFGLLLFAFFMASLFGKRTPTFYFFLFLTLFFLFLCLPKLKIMGASIAYSPLSWLHYIPFFNNIRNPSRAVSMVYLFMPMVVAVGLEQWRILNDFRWKTFAVVLLFIVTIIEFWPKPYSRISTHDVEPVFAAFAENEAIQTIWNIPTGMNDGFQGIGQFEIKQLQRQIAHGKNIYGAYVSRLDDEDFYAMAIDPVFQYFNNQLPPEAKPNELQIHQFLAVYTPDLAIINASDDSLKTAFEILFKQYIVTKVTSDGMAIYTMQKVMLEL